MKALLSTARRHQAFGGIVDTRNNASSRQTAK
jgi:hypothetical protein